MTFAEKLSRYRKLSGLSQKELAERAGVSFNTICNYETGKRLPRKPETYTALANALQIHTKDLMDDADIPTLSTLEGREHADALVQELSGLFAGGTLSDEDRDAVMKALQEVYWESKNNT